MMTMTPLRPVDRGPDVEARPSRGDKTLHSIQFLRFVAATLVVIYHAYISFIPSSLSHPMSETAYWFGFGKVGVHIFFVISGYIMYLTSFGRPKKFDPGNFFMRRILRVYPIYWVFVMLYLAYYLPLGIAPNLSAQQFVGMLALMPASSPLVIGPAWTLSYEIYFYLVFGAVMMLGAQRGTIALTCLFIFSAGLGAVLHPEFAVAELVTNALLLEFMMGVWIARLTTLHPVPRAAGGLAIAGALAGFAGGLVWGYDRLPSAIIWGIPSALLIAGAVVLEQRQRINRFSLVRRFSWLGDSSYSLYLFHILLITLTLKIIDIFNADVEGAYCISLTVVGCIIIAAIFHAQIERPLTMKLHKMILSS